MWRDNLLEASFMTKLSDKFLRIWISTAEFLHKLGDYVKRSRLASFTFSLSPFDAEDQLLSSANFRHTALTPRAMFTRAAFVNKKLSCNNH